MDTFKNPLETVQFIPIFSYLNILSDFLFTEQCLQENDQNKQIPIVNALYEYLQLHEHNKFKKIELIRTLLQGSDLYGEKDYEYFDVTFVNAMFDYIISSLVFDKYGNIYGFLATIFCKAENLQLYEISNLVMIELENASFENEYGDNSNLNILSVGRICNELILPLFPRPNADINLLSLDYIYAQAGLMFLRPGRINTTYYKDFENSISHLTEDNLFDEYLATGHVIEKLILTEEKNLEMLKVFALPALTYYIFNSKYLFVYENMAHVISDSEFWLTAYRQLFQYTDEVFNNMEIELKNDFTLKMHVALSTFQSTTAMDKTSMEHHCTFLLKYVKSFSCEDGISVSDMKVYFKYQINYITKLYEIYDFQLLQKAFPKYLILNLEQSNVVIKLLILNNRVEYGNFSELMHPKYDILEFYFPDEMKLNHYFLKREDYKAVLIDQDKSQFSDKRNRIYLKELFSRTSFQVLKKTDENITVFFQNLIQYKTSRLQSYLEFFDNSQVNNKSLKSDWWKEFGFSLVPYYLCLSDTSRTNYEDNCTMNEIKFLYKHQNDSSKLINSNTSSFLSSIGTSIKSVFLKNASYEAVDKILTKQQEYRHLLTDALNRSEVFEDISQHIGGPAFQLTFATKDKINMIKKIFNSLKEKTDFEFTSVISSLSKMSILKSNFFRSVGTVGRNRSRLIFVNTLDNKSDTGYGYKFIFLSDDISRIAELRTGYESKDQRLLSPVLDSPKNEKKYIVLNEVNFQPQCEYIMYEINSQLRRKPTKVLFSGISIPADESDEKCSDDRYFEKWIHFNVCQRRQRSSEKFKYEEDAINFIKTRTNFSEQQIRITLKKFTFPDNETLMHFVENWLKHKSFQEPLWSRMYIIKYPELLNKLRHELRFEEHNVSTYDGIFRIESLYSKKERREIEEDTSLETIIKDFNEQKATYSVTFHDYYAIRNFATTGYTRITRNTQEAKLMKMALYKLAVRQSDDSVEEFDLKLFRVESQPVSVFTITSSNAVIKLKKFTPAFPSVESALRFAGYPAPGFMNIVYEMIFYGPYMRAKIEQFYKNKEKKVILLPGSEFCNTNGEKVNIGGLGTVLKLTLKFKHNINEKYIWYNNIMNEIGNIHF